MTALGVHRFRIDLLPGEGKGGETPEGIALHVG
jgi:hypothetical protein